MIFVAVAASTYCFLIRVERLLDQKSLVQLLYGS